MLLRLRDISRFYGPRLILKGISFELCRKSVTLLAGPNGAGKSTLLKIMAGLTRPSSGDVVFREEENNGHTPRIGYLGHQTFIYPELTAMENLRFWASLHSCPLADAELEAMLARVELISFAEEKAKIFSRGMAQRLNLARVFLLQPEILLLDEPGTGLDSRSTVILHQEIATAKEAGAGIVWITHALEADMCRADNVAFLENKRLQFNGSAESYRAWASPAAKTDVVPPAPQDTRRAQGGELC